MALVPSPGTTGNDTIVPGDGDDELYGDPFDLDPLIKGKGGNDIVAATGDNNELYGDADTISGSGRGGNDRLEANGNFNDLFGDAEDMSGNAQGGNDTLVAHSEAGQQTVLYGDAGSMSANARGGNDRLIGGMGDDIVVGDASAMVPTARGGNDQLWGDPTGENSGGADLFFFTGLIGRDTVFDFRPGDGDKIGLDYDDVLGTLDSFDDLVINVFGGSTLIDIGASLGMAANTHTIRLAGFDNLQDTDVQFGPLVI